MNRIQKSLVIAQYIIDYSNSINHFNITAHKLLKIIYISHGYMLARHNEPLLLEPILACQYGPLVSGLYQSIRKYKDKTITRITTRKDIVLTDNEIEIIKEVVSTYIKFDATQLSAAMHHSSSPWSIARNISEDNPIISNDLIKYFYSYILNQPTHIAL